MRIFHFILLFFLHRHHSDVYSLYLYIHILACDVVHTHTHMCLVIYMYIFFRAFSVCMSDDDELLFYTHVYMCVSVFFSGDGGEDEFAWFDRIQYDLRCRMNGLYNIYIENPFEFYRVCVSRIFYFIGPQTKLILLQISRKGLN